MDLKLFALLKSYVDKTVEGAGALQGKSAYEIAVMGGFTGSEKEWLESLKGDSPYIGDNGNWFVGNEDTGVCATPSMIGYATENFVQEMVSETEVLIQEKIEENEILIQEKIDKLEQNIEWGTLS